MLGISEKCLVFKNFDRESFEWNIFPTRILTSFLDDFSVFEGPFWAEFFVVDLGYCGGHSRDFCLGLGMGPIFLDLDPLA